MIIAAFINNNPSIGAPHQSLKKWEKKIFVFKGSVVKNRTIVLYHAKS